MRKHLKFRGRLIPPEFKEVEVTLLEQSHFLDYFGIRDYDFVTPECRLVCLGDLMFVNTRGKYRTVELFIPERKTKTNSIKVSLDFWNKLKQAVEIYNNYEF